MPEQSTDRTNGDRNSSDAPDEKRSDYECRDEASDSDVEHIIETTIDEVMGQGFYSKLKEAEGCGENLSGKLRTREQREDSDTAAGDASNEPASESNESTALHPLHASNEFFIGKIREGLSARGLELSDEEERILRCPVTELQDNSAETAAVLMQKAIGALTDAYARDSSGKYRNDWVLRWRENMGWVYQNSNAFVSAVMQEWYLTAGRAQEKQATMIPRLVLIVSAAIILLIIGTCILGDQ